MIMAVLPHRSSLKLEKTARREEVHEMKLRHCDDCVLFSVDESGYCSRCKRTVHPKFIRSDNW